jgi:hypothetical protein
MVKVKVFRWGSIAITRRQIPCLKFGGDIVLGFEILGLAIFGEICTFEVGHLFQRHLHLRLPSLSLLPPRCLLVFNHDRVYRCENFPYFTSKHTICRDSS